MRWSDIPRDPPARLLRQFAGLWLAFFLSLATWQGLVRGRSTLALCAVLAASVGGLGVARLRALHLHALLIPAVRPRPRPRRSAIGPRRRSLVGRQQRPCLASPDRECAGLLVDDTGLEPVTSGM